MSISVVRQTGFVTGTIFYVGTASPTASSVTNDTTASVTVPSGAAGTVDITALTFSGLSTTSSGDQFTYQDVPAVTQVNPNSGGLTGWSTTVSGTNFTGASAVSFGGLPAVSFSVVSATQINAVVPANTAGSGDTIVTTPIGASNASGSVDNVTWVAPANPPIVTALSPSSGTAFLGQQVVITGTGFTGASGVSFGGTAAVSFSVDSDTQITAQAPGLAGGQYYVTVTTSVSISAAGTPSLYTVVASTVPVTNLQTITGTVLSASGGGIANALVTIVLSAGAFLVAQVTDIASPGSVAYTGTVTQTPVIVETNASGNYTVQLYSNFDLSPPSTYYTVVENALGAGGATPAEFTIVVPDTGGPFVMDQLRQ